MCGIVGFTSKKKNKVEILRLLTTIHHRGFDGQSILIKGQVHMGMNRLAIIDLSQNIYPMKYKKYHLVFNGEIYNYQILKQKLIKKGIVFKTNSDAEVILPLYYLYAEKAFTLLEGMFAICIYDEENQAIVLARDKSGEKPLYYATMHNNFAFSSEMKVLFSISNLKKKINTSRLEEYFINGFVQSPHTVVSSIKKIPPGAYLHYDVRTHDLAVKSYWNPIAKNITSTYAPFRYTYSPIDILDTLISNSVKARLISDVPVGCFLSGGLDSSLMSYYASMQKQHIRTYTVSFPGYEKFDESFYSSFVANMLKTTHTEVECTSEKVIDIIENIGGLIDEPIVDPAFIPTLLISKEARKNVKVVLTGEGADELFGGYSRYKLEQYREYLHRLIVSSTISMTIWKTVFGGSHKRILLPLHRRYSPQRIWDDQELGKFQQTPDNYSIQVKSPLLALQLEDFKGYLTDQLLNKVDRATMAANIEARAPYLDSQIINFAFNILSDKEKCNIFYGKIALKKLAERYFPKKFIWRKKHGFEIPLNDWLKNDLKHYAYESLEFVSKHRKIFSYDLYRNILNDHMDGSRNNTNKIWSMIVLSRWIIRNRIEI